jgi:cbb3-type cytochrome oxidase subunit 3
MRIPTIVIGIGAIIVIAAIVWMVRNNKKEAYIEARNGRCPRGTRVE